MSRKIQNMLLSLQDSTYRDFHARLMPGIDKEKIIGVRVPDVRRLAEKISGDEAEEFIKNLPHKYYEENNLHVAIIEKITDFDALVKKAEEFLPFIDNWATCDMLRPVCFKKNKPRLEEKIYQWLTKDDVYTVRFAIEMLMVHFLDEDFKEKFLEIVAGIRSDEYYINMMIAWFFATALAKQYGSAVKYIEKNRLELWVHNKAIQKALESYRIPPERKEYLKSLKIKSNNRGV